MKNRKREIRTSGSVRDEDGQHPHLLGHRRNFLHLAAGAAALPAMSRSAWAQAYPTRPVRWVVGSGAGSPIDVIARLIGPVLSERLGQPLVIENLLGANGNIAAETVANSVPDGYTLLLVGGANAINVTLRESVKFNLLRDIAPVAGLIRTPFIMAVSPSVPARTVPEFIAYAKANPGRVSMASAGNGTPQHIAGEQFKIMSGVNMVHMPYRDEPLALAAVGDDRAQVIFATMAVSIAAVRTDKVHVLAVTTATRSDVLPDIPTVGEFGPGYVTFGFAGIGIPSNTPVEVIQILNRQVNAALVDPAIKASLSERLLNPFHGSPADFGKLIAEVTEMWGKVVKVAGIEPN
jgi:tripartite-type tricarboxylate transporter receptor subunit TctC